MTVTLQEIKSEHARLADLIANFEASPPPMLVLLAAYIEIHPGERYAGMLLDDDGSPSHHLVLLPGESEEVTWTDACTWATKAGGELPTRREQSLLFANLKSEFKAAWYWSGESHEGNGSYAWTQDFLIGSQNYDYKSHEGRARSVRRVTV
jgi:hypothetical protein